MTFKNAVASCFIQYNSLNGRASRSEFWYFVLFIILVSIVLYLIGLVLPNGYAPIIHGVVLMAFAIPLFSVFVRRMHDIGGSALRVFLFCVPVVHLICLYWAAKPGYEFENEYGEAPKD